MSSTSNAASRRVVSASSSGRKTSSTAGETDGDGRIAELAVDLEPGVYRLLFRPDSPFFRGVGIEVQLDEGHYHVPLLVSSYSCVTYRGS